MRICEAGACTKPAVYRGQRDLQCAAAWCEDHVRYVVDKTEVRRNALIVDPSIQLIPGAQLEVKP